MHILNSTEAGAAVRWFELPGQGVPVVFIHGLGCASSYEYPPVVTHAGFGNRRAVLVDLPGFGYSDKPAAYDYSTTRQAAVVVELIEKLQFPEVDLFGHSMGGSIAIQVAEKLGRVVRTLAVSEPNFHSGGGFYSRKITEDSEQYFSECGFSLLVAEETTPWKGCLQHSAPHAVWRAASSLVEGVSPSWMSRFQALSCNRALIFGEYSLPDADAESLSAAGIPLHIVPEAGHSMSWENPAALAAILGQIFAQSGS